jgi:hypothetical protein
MKRIADVGVLADYSFVAPLRNPVFLPAKQRAQLTVSMEVWLLSGGRV